MNEKTFAGARAVVDDLAKTKRAAEQTHANAVEAQVAAHAERDAARKALTVSASDQDRKRLHDAEDAAREADLIAANHTSSRQQASDDHGAAAARLEAMQKQARVDDLHETEAAYPASVAAILSGLPSVAESLAKMVRDLEEARAEHVRANAALKSLGAVVDAPFSSHMLRAVAATVLVDDFPHVAVELSSWFRNAAPSGEPDEPPAAAIVDVLGRCVTATETPSQPAVDEAKARVEIIASRRRAREAWAALRPTPPKATPPKSLADASEYAVDEGRSRFKKNPTGRGARGLG
jgi:hypothetical protein